MRRIVVYCSQTGFTKRYAEWIAQALECEAVAWSRHIDFSAYDCVIFGSWHRAGSVVNLQWLLEKARMQPQTRFVVFATGAAPAEQASQEQEKVNRALEDSGAKGFYLPGGLNYDRMLPAYRVMMRLLCAMLRANRHPSPEQQAMLAQINQDCDHTDQAYIEPILEYVRV